MPRKRQARARTEALSMTRAEDASVEHEQEIQAYSSDFLFFVLHFLLAMFLYFHGTSTIFTLTSRYTLLDQNWILTSWSDVGHHKRIEG